MVEGSTPSLRDWHRLLMGDAPFLFLVEALLRTLVLYLLLMFVLRWMGKRMGGQISNLELAVMIALGAVISVPMQVPESGLVGGFLLLLCLLGMQRLLGFLGARSPTIERWTQGRPSILVQDGVLSLEALRGARISRWQLFSTLRTRGIQQLGEVRRVYLESGGLFTVLRAEHARPGLVLMPPGDEEVAGSCQRDLSVCADCGALRRAQAPLCASCGAGRWTTAVLVRQP